MTAIIIESVVVAFIMGGILGAITALHLSHGNKSTVRIDKHSDKNMKR